MCVPSLNEISESVFELSLTQIKTYDGGATEMKPVYTPLLSGDIISGTFAFMGESVI